MVVAVFLIHARPSRINPTCAEPGCSRALAASFAEEQEGAGQARLARLPSSFRLLSGSGARRFNNTTSRPYTITIVSSSTKSSMQSADMRLLAGSCEGRQQKSAEKRHQHQQHQRVWPVTNRTAASRQAPASWHHHCCCRQAGRLPSTAGERTRAGVPAPPQRRRIDWGRLLLLDGCDQARPPHSDGRPTLVYRRAYIFFQNPRSRHQRKKVTSLSNIFVAGRHSDAAAISAAMLLAWITAATSQLSHFLL